MIPGKYDIVMWRGSTWEISLNADGLDFSIYDEIHMHVRPPWTGGKPVAQPPLLLLDKDNGRIVVSAGGLTLTLTVSAADTQALTFDSGIYDLEMVRNADLTANPPVPERIVDKLIYGTVTIKSEVTI